MSTGLRDRILLLEDDKAGLAVGYPTRMQRLGVHLLGPRLDRELAAGASPDRTVLLALRAQALVSPEHRHALGARLTEVLAAARRPRTRRTPTVSIDAARVRANEAAIRRLVGQLDTMAPVPARGVALVQVLLTDGAGPLYYARDESSLGAALAQASEALDPLSTW